MYQLLLNLWIMKRIDKERVDNALGYITAEEASIIKTTPQIQ
jgi:hypothetical protein